MSSSIDSFVNNPYVARFITHIAHLQEQNMFSNERLSSFKSHLLITIGFVILLYCLNHIQILFYWLIKFIFRFFFRIISIIFWLPLTFIRFLIPKSIGYDILFPLFWLCSIGSFYLTKYSHENLCQFYDQQIVRRYKSLNYEQNKRENIRRYIFLSTFFLLLILQSLFFLLPIALSIRQQHLQQSNAIILTPTTTTVTITIRTEITTTNPTIKTVDKDTMKTMSQRLYHRFIQAFKDENEMQSNGQHSIVVNDQKLEHNVQTIVEKKLIDSKSDEITNDAKKTSRFQRWIVHYLKAPFQKWEKKTNQQENVNIQEQKFVVDDEKNDEEEEEEEEEILEEENAQVDSSSNIQGEDDDDQKENVQQQILSSQDQDQDNKDQSLIHKVKQQLGKLIGQSTNDQLLSSSHNRNDKLDNNKDKLVQSTENNQVINQDYDSGYESEDEGDDDENEQSTRIVQKLKDTLTKPIENVNNIARNTKNKIIASTDDDDDDDEELQTVTEKIKQRLAKPIGTAKELGEQMVNNLKNMLSSSDIDEDDSKIETDEEEEEEEESVAMRIQETMNEPMETVTTRLQDQLPISNKTEEKSTTTIKDKISSSVNQLKHRVKDLVHSAEEFASNVVDKSTEYVEEKVKTIGKKSSKINKSTIQHDLIEPVKKKSTEIKKSIRKKPENLKKQVNNENKSIKKNKKSKSTSHPTQNKPIRKKKKSHSFNPIQSKLNGRFDDAWNIWHLTKRHLSHIFISSSKHARHRSRYNTTSIYTAYTDLKCYDYTKKINRYRADQRKYVDFIHAYRHHSPFLVYLSILKSNGPCCYRQYPDSSCGLIVKESTRNVKTQLYRFAQFWAIIGILIMILSIIYKNFSGQQRTNSLIDRRYDDSDRSSRKQQQRTTNNSLDVYNRSKSTLTSVEQSSTINRPTISSNSNDHTNQLNNTIKQHLQTWLEFEQNNGFRNLSEICRIAMNNTFLKQLERLSVETLQFANAKIYNVSQNNNIPTAAEKITINGILDIDHLILNIVNTFKEQHFSLETPKLCGQLTVILTIHSDQYEIEANIQQLEIKPVNIIDPNNVLLSNEKQSIVKLLDEIICRTFVRYCFHLSDIQENVHVDQLQNSYFDRIQSTRPLNKLSPSSVQSYTSSSRQLTPTKYSQSESLPIVLVNDTDPNLYNENDSIDRESKRLLVRIVKAVKLHDVEQPYCILELNQPKQIHQTSIAKNGLNPFWDERFLFECDDKSNQIHLQVVDRKKDRQKHSDTYTDTLYADVSIPFSYIASTVYKQDVQISPQYPESILRIEFSTLSEVEALAANNGYDVESLTDSQTWMYNDRETSKIEQDYSQQFQQHTSANDYTSASYDSNTLPKQYGLSTSFFDDEREYASTLPRVPAHHSYSGTLSPSSHLTPRIASVSGNDKPQKSKSFMSSLKHLTLPRRKHRNKDKNDNSMNSQTSSTSQLNTSFQSPSNPVSHSLSTALPGQNSNEYFLSNTNEPTPIRRSRSISRSFKNLFRSSSKKKTNTTKTDTSVNFDNIDHRNFVPLSAPTTKKLSFLQRRKSKTKSKEQTNLSTNSLSSYDCSRLESIRDTPVRANVGHPVTMTKSLVH